MRKCTVLFLAALVATLVIGCVTSPPAQAVQPVKLAELNWDPFNRTQLENFLNANGKAR
jgi:hypothetical protein